MEMEMEIVQLCNLKAVFFLIKGETTACLKQDGTQPLDREMDWNGVEDDFMCLTKSVRTGRET